MKCTRGPSFRAHEGLEPGSRLPASRLQKRAGPPAGAAGSGATRDSRRDGSFTYLRGAWPASYLKYVSPERPPPFELFLIKM